MLSSQFPPSPDLRALPEDRYGIVVSRYHFEVTGKLLEGALQTLDQHGVDERNVETVWAPGAFEIPVLSHELAKTGRLVAVITLAAVIQGETDHHDYINHAVAQGVMLSSQNTGIPILFGVLTCRTMEQARERAGGRVGNKGAEAAQAALETVAALRSIR